MPGAVSLGHDDGEKTSSGRNAKRREARKKAKAAEEGWDSAAKRNGVSEHKDIAVDKSATAKENWRPEAPSKDVEVPVDAEAEKEKQARNLKKKLRQARELREKKDKGENLLPEQFEKVIKINELIRQLDSLGFDAQGERKGHGEGES